MKKPVQHFIFAIILGLLGLAGALTLPGLGADDSLIAQAAGATQPTRPGAAVYCVAVISNTYPGCTQVFTNIQAAVDAALPDDLIKVASGVYTDVHLRQGVTQVVYLSKTLTLQGGYTITNWITPSWEANPTTLDAQGQGRGFYIIGPITPVIEGLCITGGQADWGGGIYLRQATGLLRDNAIFSNTASQGGGGLYLRDAMVEITGNLITSNTTQYAGGGICGQNVQGILEGNTVVSNTAGETGGGILLHVSAMTVSNNSLIANTSNLRAGGLGLWDNTTQVRGNRILSNTAFDNGGGIYLWYGVNTVANNEIAGNSAFYSGGGIFFDHSTQNIDGNVVTSNKAQSGGGLYLLSLLPITLTNMVVADNQVSVAGSGIYIDRGGYHVCTLNFLHTTIARNSGGDGSGIHLGPGCSLAITNTILANQGTGFFLEGSSQATLDGILWYSNNTNYTGLGTIVVTHEITGTPAFTTDGYHLAPGSTAIDRGLNTGVDHDIDDHPRPFGDGYDLGADEFATSLLLAKQVSTDIVRAGAQLTYTLILTNTGFVDLHAIITDTLPDQVTPTGAFTWTVVVTAPNGVWIQPIVVTVTPGYSGTLTNYAQVIAQEGIGGEAQVTIKAIGFRYYLPLISKD